MRGVEVAVGEAVAHPGDLRPGECRFVGKQLSGESLDRFADLDQADPNGVEDEPVGQVAALEVGVDGAISAMASSRLYVLLCQAVIGSVRISGSPAHHGHPL